MYSTIQRLLGDMLVFPCGGQGDKCYHRMPGAARVPEAIYIKRLIDSVGGPEGAWGTTSYPGPV